MIFRGVFHAHSRYSYDGRFSLRDLRSELQKRGFHFLLLTEHDDTLDAVTYQRVVSDCRELTHDEFLIVAGLEIRCRRAEKIQWHIAAVGAEDWIERGPISKVVESIHRMGALAILLHPFQYASQIDVRELEQFDGIELWNGKNDGQRAPRLKSLRLAQELGGLNPRPNLYVGQDLHDLDGLGSFALEVEAVSLEKEAVLRSLRAGQFQLMACGFRMPATLGLSTWQSLRLTCRRAVFTAYVRSRKLPVVGGGLGLLLASFRRIRSWL
jgi:predicted metal-dependent phosphoesterase TrpH